MGSSIRGNDGLDWNDVRFFLAVARARTMRRAARALGVDETTVGRRLASLEERFGVALFERRPGGFEPTDAGARLVASAERMDEAARELAAWTVDGVATKFKFGSVRIATGEGLAERFVVPALRELQARHPDLQATVVTGWEPVDLRKGEADLAVRLARPKDPRLASRRLARLTFRLYASREYLERAGPVTSLAGHPVIGYEDAMRRSGHAFTDLPSTGGHTALLINSGRVLVAAGVAGIGIVQLPRYQGDANPALTGVLPEVRSALRGLARGSPGHPADGEDSRGEPGDRERLSRRGTRRGGAGSGPRHGVEPRRYPSATDPPRGSLVGRQLLPMRFNEISTRAAAPAAFSGHRTAAARAHPPRSLASVRLGQGLPPQEAARRRVCLLTRASWPNSWTLTTAPRR